MPGVSECVDPRGRSLRRITDFDIIAFLADANDGVAQTRYEAITAVHLFWWDHRHAIGFKLHRMFEQIECLEIGHQFVDIGVHVVISQRHRNLRSLKSESSIA